MARSSEVWVEALTKTGTRLTIGVSPTSGYIPFVVTVSGNLYDVFATGLIGKTINLYITEHFLDLQPLEAVNLTVLASHSQR
jgi:hypothetical protein